MVPVPDGSGSAGSHSLRHKGLVTARRLDPGCCGDPAPDRTGPEIWGAETDLWVLNREIDPLGERNLTGIVDGVRGPTHVTLPCVRPRLTTTTCLLLAAERPADLGA